jgi:hypothetical protein
MRPGENLLTQIQASSTVESGPQMTKASSMILQPATRCRRHATLSSNGEDTRPAGEATV